MGQNSGKLWEIAIVVDGWAFSATFVLSFCVLLDSLFSLSLLISLSLVNWSESLQFIFKSRTIQIMCIVHKQISFQQTSKIFRNILKSLKWNFPQNKMTKWSTKWQFFSFSFHLQNIKRHDQGIYRCRVDFRTSQTQSFRYNLTIISK